MGIHDPKQLAIELTVIGLRAGKDYTFNGVEVYMLQGADGTDYIVKCGTLRQVFLDAHDAVRAFIDRGYDATDC